MKLSPFKLRLLVFAASTVAPLFATAVEDSRPNILVILSDDAGYADFGFTGGTDIPTPHLDRIASGGVYCKQGYVTASVCCPSRMGLMTGRYQQRFGAECNVPMHPTPGYTEQDLGMDTDEQNLGALLQDAGYRTAILGKWHLGEHDQYHPNPRGYDYFYGLLDGSRSYWAEPKFGEDHPKRILRNADPVNEQEELTYLTDDLTDEALQFIRTNADQPFFMFLSYTAPHGPLHARDDYLQEFAHIEDPKRQKYAAMLHNMDDNIGRVLAVLDELELEDNTLIFFLNDNGGATNNGSSNGALRGAKGSYWEGGIRVPFLVKWPGKLPAGATYEEPVISLDVAATVLAAAGAPAPKQALDGRNLLPHLDGSNASAPHEALFWRSWRVAVCRQGKWKLLAVRDDALQAEREELLPLRLFNLEADPGEQEDVAASHPEVVAELSKQLSDWESELGAPRWYDGNNWQHWQEVQVENHR